MQNLRDARAELIQKKTEHYIPIFNSMEQGKSATWNWCGFLVGPLWFAYRKMYGAAALAFAVIYFGGVAISMLAAATGNPEISYIGKTFNFAWAAVQGGMANRVYWWHITRLANHKEMGQPDYEPGIEAESPREEPADRENTDRDSVDYEAADRESTAQAQTDRELAEREDAARERFVRRKGGVSKAAVVWAIIIILAVDITGIWL